MVTSKRIVLTVCIVIIALFCFKEHRPVEPLTQRGDEPPVEPNYLTGTRTAAGAIVYIRPAPDGFTICVNNPKEGLLATKVGKNAFVVFHNYVLHQREELKPEQVIEWLKTHKPDHAMIGIHDGKVSDVILAVCDE